jgi:hypothetical protein
MRRTGRAEVVAKLAATPDQVWARVSTPEGINHELMPIMRMTFPGRAGTLDLNDVPVGEPLGRCWVLLFGLIPVDYDDLMIVRLEPGRGFLERSRMLSNRLWEHERTLEPIDDGCLIRDRLRFEPRPPLPGRFEAPIVRALFRHRHRRLRRHFGAIPD